MKRISGEFLDYVLSSNSPAGSDDSVIVWVDNNVLYMLVANTSLNYAGLSSIEMCDRSWTDIIFVQSDQHHHAEALSFCKVKNKADYSEGYECDRYIYTCNSLDIAQLCVDYPKQMREYFRQWE
jgi:hypothetical protein